MHSFENKFVGLCIVRCGLAIKGQLDKSNLNFLIIHLFRFSEIDRFSS